MTLDSQPFHSASGFQFPKKKCGNQVKPCQINWLKSFPGCIMTLIWLSCLVWKEPMKSVSDKNLAK